ncbi:metal ABC transporter substrate-binding protein [Aquipuribacter hungaricus]|uniref:Metal ABC transporter substrate-binding protein n=1 Tax=Aquipuribacter hungaricus TaxID=545624 RepID=A0ABV7WDL7_9MICO
MRPAPRALLLAPVVATVLTVAACGGGTAAGGSTDEGAAGGGAAAAQDGGLQVVAAFYPLQFLTSRVAGDRAEVTSLTPPGAEPHDLELSPQSLAGLGEADLVVVLGGFQPSLDDALGTSDAPVLDLAEVADRPYEGQHDDAHEGEGEEDHAAEETHADEETHGDEDGATDPHFWTDPTHMAEAAEQVAAALSEADPEGAEAYEAGAAALAEELGALDTEAQEALASCEVTTLVTAHDAFGYFADRYGFEVRPVNGITPDQEPDAGTLAELSDFVAAEGVTTVYTETLVSSAVADTVAAEAGVQTAVLDPLEGLTDDSSGEDYLEIMRANIDVVRDGQSCA